jgi:hypothetical protein
MHLAWTFMRFQDDLDCSRPDAKLFAVKLVAKADHEDSAADLLDMFGADPWAGCGPPTGRGSVGPAFLRELAEAGALGRPDEATSALIKMSASGGGAMLSSTLRSEASTTLQAAIAAAVAADVAAMGSAVAGGDDGGGDEAARVSGGGLGGVACGGGGGGGGGSVQLVLERHAEPDSHPFVVEPAEKVSS